MTNILIHGCNGRMGTMCTELAEERQDISIVAGVDKAEGNITYPVYENIVDVKEKADVIIDVSTASAIDGLLDYVEDTKIPTVICTTGLSMEQEERIKSISKNVAVLRSGNMTMGINTLLKVLKDISGSLNNAGFDVEIVEKHHNKKIDAPSGTAIMLADAVKEGTKQELNYVYGRSDRREARPHDEIGISSIRGGTIVGEHEVIFAGVDEVIEIKHTVLSRAALASGALNAAAFLSGKEPGFYSMSDVIG